MVQILPPKFNIGSQIGQALGMGLQQGAGSALQNQFNLQGQEQEFNLKNKLSQQQNLQKRAQIESFLQSQEGQSLSQTEKNILKGVASGAIPESSVKTFIEENRKREEQNILTSLLGQSNGNRENAPSNEGSQQQNASQSTLSQLPEDKLAILVGQGGKIGELGKFELERRKAEKKLSQSEKQHQFREFESKRDFEFKRAGPILQKAEEMAEAIPLQQANIDLIKNSINEGNVGGLDQDYLADLLHFEPLRTAKGTQLKSAGKDLFIKTLQGTGARPNQWIEQQISSALTQIGKSPEANLTIAEMSQFQLDLNKKRVEFTQQVADKYIKELGYVPGNIGKEVNELMKAYVPQRQNQLAYDLRVLYEREQGSKKLKELKPVPPGTPLTIEKARVLLEKYGNNEKRAEEQARKLGYTIPTNEVYMRESQ